MLDVHQCFFDRLREAAKLDANVVPPPGMLGVHARHNIPKKLEEREGVGGVSRVGCTQRGNGPHAQGGRRARMLRGGGGRNRVEEMEGEGNERTKKKVNKFNKRELHDLLHLCMYERLDLGVLLRKCQLPLLLLLRLRLLLTDGHRYLPIIRHGARRHEL